MDSLIEMLDKDKLNSRVKEVLVILMCFGTDAMNYDNMIVFDLLVGEVR